jgi:glycosyltransferase involved in cell wall biosynthesis
MRIALVTSSFLPRIGGMEFVIHNLARQWHEQGHEVCVFNAVTGQSPADNPGYLVRRYGTPRTFFRLPPHWPPFCKMVSGSLGRQLKEFCPDFISAHSGYPLSIWLSRMQPTPRFLMTCHGGELTKFSWGYRNVYKMERVLAQALNRSAGAVAISRHARVLMEEMGVAPGTIVDIPNGVDLPRFQKDVSFDFRRFLGLPAEALLLLSVGREHPQKAFDTGIRAFARVADQFPGLYYVLLGRGNGKWQPLVRELGLEGRVICHEGLSGDDLVGAYQQADIFFSPSVWEMMPLVVLEAQACGLPLLVTNVSGSQDIVRAGCNGIMVEPGDEGAMAQAMAELASNRQLRQSLGAISRQLSRQYSWENISKRYLAVGSMHDSAAPAMEGVRGWQKKF